ncbi:hypothetical protein D3C73_1080280 [compost metagenome]
MFKFLNRLFKRGVKVVPQGNDIFLANAVIPLVLYGTLKERAQALFNPTLIELIAQLFMVKIVEPGICQNLSQVNFTEQAQRHRVTGGGGRSLTGKASD